MNVKLIEFYKKSYSSANEQYLPTSEMDDFINICDTNDIAILGVEFFIINSKGIQPFEEISGFDAATLFNQDSTRYDNVTRCNSFIRECFNKIKGSLEDLYFAATLEYEA